MDEFLKILGVDSDKLKTDAKNRRRDEGIGCSICDFSGYIDILFLYQILQQLSLALN